MLSLALGLAAFGTAVLSGLLGMAGGLVLLGVFTALLPLPVAMVLHGLAQLVANASRAGFLRAHVAWRTVGAYALGAAVATAVLAGIRPGIDASTALVVAGAAPFVAALVPWRPDAGRPITAAVAGVLVQTLQIVGGVGGPLLDVFFLDGRLDRHGVVATKAATQALSHLAKIGWWGGLVGSGELSGDTAALVVGAALVGTRVGTWLLARLAEADFRRATRVVVRVVGAAYVAWGLGLIP